MKTPKERKRSSVRTEARVARDHGGQRVPRSGAGHTKGDGRAAGKFRIENKETGNLSYRLHVQEWTNLVSIAQKAGEIPVYHIALTDRFGKRHELAVLRYQDYLGFMRSLGEIE